MRLTKGIVFCLQLQQFATDGIVGIVVMQMQISLGGEVQMKRQHGGGILPE